MFIEIKHQLYLTTNNIPLLAEIKKRLTFRNPSYEKTIALGYSAHNIPTHYCCYHRYERGLIVPRGSIRLVINLAKSYGEPVQIKDSRTVGESLDVDLESQITPYWYQSNAIQAILDKTRGLIIGPCGVGKSVIAIFAIVETQLPTMIIVHTSELYRQWKNEIQKHLSGKFSIGLIGGGQKHIGHITIATVQTLSKLPQSRWEQIRKQFGMTFLDEAHHAGAESYVKVMENIQSKYVIGLTATPKRKDKKDFLISTYLGDIIYTIYDQDLETCGKSVQCEVIWHETKIKFNYTKLGRNHVAFSGEIAKHLERCSQIVDNVVTDITNGEIPMVIVERKVHAQIIKSLLEDKGYNVSLCTGSVEQAERDRIKSDLERDNTQVLVANKHIAAEGMNIPCLSSIHLTFYTTAFGAIKQMVGRIRRSYGEKQRGLVWFYVDDVVETVVDEDTFTEAEQTCSKFKYGYNSIFNYFKKLGFTFVGEKND